MGATVFVQPLDLVKNRMQGIKVLKGEKRPTSLSVLMGVVRNEGVKVASSPEQFFILLVINLLFC